jgi:hypothetical protein
LAGGARFAYTGESFSSAASAPSMPSLDSIPVKPKPRRRKGLPGWSLKVDRSDFWMQPQDWKEWLRRVWFAASVGIAASAVAHAVAMAVLAWWQIEPPKRPTAEPLELSWNDGNVIAPTMPERKPVSLAAPVTLGGAGKSEPAAGSASAAAPTSATNNASGSVPVRPAGVGGALSGRGLGSGGSGSGGAVEKLGGTSNSQAAIKAGLAWLARQQNSDGRWELHQGYPDAGFSVVRTDTGATALALLAFLGAGHTPTAGEHAKVVRKGVQWLVDTQDRATGDLHDMRQEEGRQPAFYAHAMATIALCEALALTGDDKLREPAQRAVEYLVESQHPELGGWKYRPISKTMVGDLSVTGWALMALHTARMAGLHVANSDFERAAGFLDSVAEQNGSRYKYEPLDPPQRITAALTAEGLLCRQWLGWPKDHPPLQSGVKWLLEDERRPEWSAGRRNVYAWYYTAQVMHNMGDEAWRTWYPPVRDLIVKHQVTSGSAKSPSDVRGSWHPTQPPGVGEEYGDKAGRLYVTALCLLILETPYRHRAIYEE